MKPLFFKNAIALGLAATLSFSCAKTRNAELPEEQKNGTLAINEVQGATFKASVSGNARAANSAANEGDDVSIQEKLVADLNLTDKAVIVLSSIPERYQFLFKNVEVYNYGQSEVNILIGLDKSNLTAYQEISSSQLKSGRVEMSIALTKEEIDARFQIGKSASPTSEVQNVENLKIAKQKSLLTSESDMVYIPLFKVALKSYGILQKKKNDLKEETSVLELKATDWDRASHLQISDFSKDRLDIVISNDIVESRKAMVEVSSVNGKTLSLDGLNAKLKLSGEQSLKLNKDSLFFTQLGKENIRIFEYTIMTDALKAQLGQNANLTVAACPASIEKDLKDKNVTCALLARVDIKVVGQKIDLDSEKGIDKNTVSIKEVKDLSSSSLILIKDSKVISEQTLESTSSDLKAILAKIQS